MESTPMNNNDIISIGNTATNLIPEEGEVISIRGRARKQGAESKEEGERKVLCS